LGWEKPSWSWSGRRPTPLRTRRPSRPSSRASTQRRSRSSTVRTDRTARRPPSPTSWIRSNESWRKRGERPRKQASNVLAERFLTSCNEAIPPTGWQVFRGIGKRFHSLREIADTIRRHADHPPKTPLTPAEIGLTTAAYFATAGILIAVGIGVAHVPGADIAFKALRS
jgi:hypothetical protein